MKLQHGSFDCESGDYPITFVLHRFAKEGCALPAIGFFRTLRMTTPTNRLGGVGFSFLAPFRTESFIIGHKACTRSVGTFISLHRHQSVPGTRQSDASWPAKVCRSPLQAIHRNCFTIFRLSISSRQTPTGDRVVHDSWQSARA